MEGIYMFINKQPQKNVNEYLELLRIMGSLSNLYSENTKPYLDYRATENLFCLCLDAENLSRSDCTADASKNNIGIGIKTFLNSATGHSMQKIAEFNKQRKEYDGLSAKELILTVSNFRNERIHVTQRIHDLTNMLYHCSIRDTGKIFILENQMDYIDIDNINVTSLDDMKNVIHFNDRINEYGFNRSKSVLYKRFFTKNILYEIGVDIIDNPYSLLKELLSSKSDKLIFRPIKTEYPFVILPLFSTRGGVKHVPEKSGLNQWNAAGRARHVDELYVPIPQSVHSKFPNFFPSRDKIFNLKLPNGTILSAKLCQEGNKALMSNPNFALGKWLLRHVMQVPQGELLTMKTLERIGLDSVIIYKLDESNYSIDFMQIGSYEHFIAGFCDEE